MTKQGRAADVTAAVPSPPGCLIEARNLVRSFGQTPALRGASLSWLPGKSWR